DSTDEPINVMDLVQNKADCSGFARSDSDAGVLWCTNLYDDPLGKQPDGPARLPLMTRGIQNQMLISFGDVDVPDTFWRNFSSQAQRGSSIEDFKKWFNDTNAAPNNYDAPFQP